MSGLSLVRATAPDVLVNSLKFDLPDTASYIKERSNTTFWPLGGNIYSPTQGTRLIRFVLSDGTGFLDPSSVVFTCSLVNTSAVANRALRFRGPPITMFRRIRVLAGGTLIEDIQEAARLAQLLQWCDTRERNENNKIFSNWDEDEAAAGVADAGIARNLKRRIVTDLRIIGLMRVTKHIPLQWCPITLELELADGAEIFWGNSVDGAAGNPPAVNRSQSFALEDVTIQCDIVKVLPELLARYDSLLDSRNNLTIPFTTWATTRHTLAGAVGEYDIQTTRSLSLLKTVFLTFSHTDPNTIAQLGAVDERALYGTSNLFLNPRYATAGERTTANDAFQWQVVIGGNAFPTFPCRGVGG